jgi:hypothetical protein
VIYFVQAGGDLGVMKRGRREMAMSEFYSSLFGFDFMLMEGR